MLSHFSPAQLFATPWTGAHQASLSMGFSRQEYWSGLPCPPPPGDLPHPGIEPVSPSAPALAARFFTTEPLVKPFPPPYQPGKNLGLKGFEMWLREPTLSGCFFFLKLPPSTQPPLLLCLRFSIVVTPSWGVGRVRNASGVFCGWDTMMFGGLCEHLIQGC